MIIGEKGQVGEGPIKDWSGLRSKILDRLFAEDSFDVLLSLDPDNCRYISGYRSMMADMSPHYRVGVVASRDRVVLVTSAGDLAAAREVLGSTCDIVTYGEFYLWSEQEGMRSVGAHAEFDAALRSVLADFAPAPRLAIDSTGTKALALNLDGMLRPGQVIAPTDAVPRARRLKFPEEIHLLGQAAAMLDAGLTLARGLVREGATELDISGEIARLVSSRGGVARSLAITSGLRSGNVDAFATPRAFEQGDLVRMDLSASYHGYWADMARTVVVGESDQEQEMLFGALLEGLDAGREVLRGQVTASAVFQAMMARVRDSGIADYQRHHCGHGIGVTINEYPLIGPNSHVPIEPGMVLCIETPLYREGWGGMMAEDMVAVTIEGLLPLSAGPLDLHATSGMAECQ
ncbi:Xaa-Pro peptidase family protein [Devosia sp. 2618]|uniref:Xaa-Pro peptidase family protein n=1 Tax=Devosia sp. 2618 TaxID=3156454 RepID=UPI0033982C6C